MKNPNMPGHRHGGKKAVQKQAPNSADSRPQKPLNDAPEEKIVMPQPLSSAVFDVLRENTTRFGLTNRVIAHLVKSFNCNATAQEVEEVLRKLERIGFATCTSKAGFDYWKLRPDLRLPKASVQEGSAITDIVFKHPVPKSAIVRRIMAEGSKHALETAVELEAIASEIRRTISPSGVIEDASFRLLETGRN